MAAASAAAVAAAGLGLNTAWDDTPSLTTDTAQGPGDGAPASSGPLDEAGASSLARETGEPVEVTALTTSTNTTVALPEGGFELTSYTVPVRARADGQWKTIDTTLEPEGAGGWAPKATNHPVTFHPGSGQGQLAERASRSQAGPRQASLPAQDDGQEAGAQWFPLVTLTAGGGHEVTMAWPAPLPEPVINGPSALYPGVLEGVDLLLTARDSGFSHVLIVRTAEAAQNPELEQVAYRLTSPTLTFDADPETLVVHALDEDGNEIAASPSPFMWDSAGEPAVTQGPDPQPAHPDGLQPAPEADAEPLEGVFALPGLEGPQPGTNDAVADLTLDGDGVVTVVPDAGLLSAESTVFPVFVDPSWTAGTNNWTFAYDRYPTTSFWNGQNFNNGTDTARVGYESTTGGTSRSYFQLDWDTSLQGAHISSATFYGLNTYSWSCTDKSIKLYRTATISSSTTWNNRPTRHELIDSRTVTHGYSSSCPDDWISFNAKTVAQKAADSGWSTITVGLQAGSESDPYYWKKLQANSANSPYLKATYNRPPVRPVDAHTIPGGPCDYTDFTTIIGNSDITFKAKSWDADGNLSHLDFEVWEDGHSGTKLLDNNVPVHSSGWATETVPSSSFTDGKQYWWRVRAIDSSGAKSTYAPPGTGNCGFTYDASAPNPPTVTTTDFPEATADAATWSTVPFGTTGEVTFGAAGTTDTIEYEYSVNSYSYGSSVTVAAGQDATIALAPPNAGPNELVVRAVDTGGNISTRTSYLFYVTPRDTADSPGDVTGDGKPDLFAVNALGNLVLYPGDGGDVHTYLPAAHNQGKTLPDGYWTDTQGNPALISHHGDYLPGDGLTDLIARMPDGNLYLYPGDGYGGIDTSKRLPALLPEDAPSPAELDEIKATGDISGDGLPDLFAIAGQQLWAFTGYTGGAFADATLLYDGFWDNRELVNVADISGDGTADLLWRDLGDSKLWLREGIPGTDGGVDLQSLTRGSLSAKGTDNVYGEGWISPGQAIGTPDVNGDGIPDIWSVWTDGSLHVYYNTTTAHGPQTEVGGSGWLNLKTLG